MKNTVTDFINLIKEKTGIAISVYDSAGASVQKSALAPEKVDPVNEVTLNEDGGYTLFPIKIGAQSFVAHISGVEGFNVKFALLIKELADGFNNKSVELTKKEFYKSLILGELSQGVIAKYLKKYSIPNKKCFVFIVCADISKMADVLSVLENYVNEPADHVLKLDDGTCAVIKFYGVAQSEYKSTTEYADYLLKSVYEECGVLATAFVGKTVTSPLELEKSYMEADQANKSAKLLGVKGDAHSFKEYVLVKMIRDLPKHKVSEYLDLITDEEAKSVFADEEIVITAEEFLENNLNVSETARKLFIHRNTLIYRIDKIEKSTGLNIRNFADALTFRLMTIFFKVN